MTHELQTIISTIQEPTYYEVFSFFTEPKIQCYSTFQEALRRGSKGKMISLVIRYPSGCEHRITLCSDNRLVSPESILEDLNLLDKASQKVDEILENQR